jgi:hypothetical protein
LTKVKIDEEEVDNTSSVTKIDENIKLRTNKAMIINTNCNL